MEVVGNRTGNAVEMGDSSPLIVTDAVIDKCLDRDDVNILLSRISVVKLVSG